MAIWQYDMHLIPRSSVLALVGHPAESLTQEQFDEMDWWYGLPVPDFSASFDACLSRTASWSPRIWLWGVVDATCVEVLFDDSERVQDCRARVDMRHSPREFLSCFVAFADRYDCLVLTPEWELREPDLENLVLQMRRSSAYRYCQDPLAFFRDVNDEW